MLYSMHFQDQTSLQPFLREGKKTWDGVGLRIEPGKSSMLSRLLGPPAPYLTFCGSFPSEPGRQPAGRDHIWSSSLCFSLQIFWGTSGQTLSSACIPSQLQERPGIVSGLAQALVYPCEYRMMLVTLDLPSWYILDCHILKGGTCLSWCQPASQECKGRSHRILGPWKNKVSESL